jgi:CheY-like chemotaxis protein/anti-sigma regulatory factor (Ser/Thr protein kinase)
MIDVLQQTSLLGYQVEIVDTIRESAYALLGIVEDILDFSKIESGKLEIESLPMSVAVVVEKACSMLYHLARKQQLELTLFTDPAIPTWVLGDAARLRQVIINLAHNAIKFCNGTERSGRVSVRAVLTGAAAATDGVQIDIAVTDNGIGMDEAMCDRLFTAFTQADASTTRRFGGTGLGLAICSNLVAMMGGSITVNSVPGAGSVFCVHLSLLPVAAEVGASAATAVAPLVGLSCLVVGDDDSLADDLSAYLVADGAWVTRANDLAAARISTPPKAGVPWVWLMAHEADLTALNAWRETVTALAKHPLRLVILERGARKYPRWLDPDQHILTLDANLLMRADLCQAVAIAGGCLTLKTMPESTGKSAVALRSPPRAQALAQRQLVLLAEDNATNQKVTLQQLALLGFAADVASNGQEALALWCSGDYALLLTDLHMPKMDGYELATAIRADEQGSNRRIPIVALTANTIKGEAQRCKDIGMDDYLSKPTPTAELKAMLAKWLPAQPAPPSPSQPLAIESALDVSILAALVGDNPATIADFLQDFQASATTIAAELEAAWADANAAHASALAHKLKASARSVGALTLGMLCEEIEAAGKTGSIELMALLLPRFKAEIAAVYCLINQKCALYPRKKPP